MVDLGGGSWDPASPTTTDQSNHHTLFKVENWFLARELAGQVHARDILSTTQTKPGHPKGSSTSAMMRRMSALLLHNPKMGPYTVS